MTESQQGQLIRRANVVALKQGEMPTADDVNDAHRLARGNAESAVQHAIRCGELLLQAKAQLKHGEFKPWIASSCEFAYSTAKRYMKAADQKATAVAFSSVRHLFDSGKPRQRLPAPAPGKWNPIEASVRIEQAIELEFGRYGGEKDDRPTVAYILRQLAKGYEA